MTLVITFFFWIGDFRGQIGPVKLAVQALAQSTQFAAEIGGKIRYKLNSAETQF